MHSTVASASIYALWSAKALVALKVNVITPTSLNIHLNDEVSPLMWDDTVP